MSTTTNTEEKDKQLTVEGAVGNTLTPAQIEAGKQMYADIQAGYNEQYTAMEQAQNDNLELEKKATEAAKKKLDDAAHDEMQKAYTDYERETGRYGVNAEAMAASGMSRTGYSESARVRAYAAYQNRVATTKAALASAKSDYDLKMQQAVMQNNVALAEIAFASFQQRTELLISQFNAGLYEYDGLDDQADEGAEEMPFFVNGEETPRTTQPIFDPDAVKYGDNKMSKEEQNYGIFQPTLEFGANKLMETADYDVDIDSIKRMGLGNIPLETLETMVKQGYVEEYVEGGKIKYRLTDQGKKSFELGVKPANLGNRALRGEKSQYHSEVK